MTDRPSQADHGPFQASRVRAQVRQVLKAIPARLAAIVGLLIVLPQAISGAALPYVIMSGAPDESLWPAVWGLEFVAFVIISSGFWLAQAAVVYATGTELEGEPADLAECLSAIFSNLSSLLIQGVIAFAWIGFMSLLLVIPGAMALSGWLVGLPVHIIEDRAPLAAFRRSEQLTLNCRQEIFGMFMLIAGSTVAAWFVAKAFLGLVGMAAPQVAFWLSVVVEPGIVAAGVAVGAVTITAIYIELRLTKEGVAAHDVSEVFT